MFLSKLIESVGICYFLLLFVSIIIPSCGASDAELGTIIFANIVYRHGARTPIETYPNDPWGNESLWPAPFGHLTNEHSNKTLPAWTKSVFPHQLGQFVVAAFECLAKDPILRRLSGSLMNEMVTHMIQKSENALVPDRKLFMYSAHGETVTGLLGLLGFVEFPLPPYVATVLIELRLNSEKEHVVTISYKNSTGEPTLLTLPGCPTACPLSQFLHLTKNLISEDKDEEDISPTSGGTTVISSTSAKEHSSSIAYTQSPSFVAKISIGILVCWKFHQIL